MDGKCAVIVVPLSVLDNWIEEIKAFSDLSVVRYAGTKDTREEIRGLISSKTVGNLFGTLSMPLLLIFTSIG